MSSFDPYENLLRNFSKHKFKIFIENTLFKPNKAWEDNIDWYGTYFKDYWTVDKEKWEKTGVAHVDIPNVGMLGLTSFHRWIFFLDHLENDLIAPNMIYPRAIQHLTEMAKHLSSEKDYLTNLLKKLTDEQADWPMNVFFYYLTNATFDPRLIGNDSYNDFISNSERNIQTHFLKGARKHKLDFNNVELKAGLGNPKSFLENERKHCINTIKEIEARPDSLHLQFVEGKIDVISSNKRKVYAFDKNNPKMVTLDQIVNPESFFTADEVDEFESLLNKPRLREEELQKFFSGNPKFLKLMDYDEIRPQISLIDESNEKLIPDFFLKPVGKRLWDILDIKLPSARLVAGSPNRRSLSSVVHRGNAQLMNYSKFFDETKNREKVFKVTGIDCFKPRLILVIGKKNNVDEQYWNQIIAQERPFVKIVGYDELLEKARRSSLEFKRIN